MVMYRTNLAVGPVMRVALRANPRRHVITDRSVLFEHAPVVKFASDWRDRAPK